uniref:Uncharacterized protein n=1 Tax=Rhizophora mucronata TaxID=61149 RepID=A0A2P2IMK7_RHIMU
MQLNLRRMTSDHSGFRNQHAGIINNHTVGVYPPTPSPGRHLKKWGSIAQPKSLIPLSDILRESLYLSHFSTSKMAAHKSNILMMNLVTY